MGSEGRRCKGLEAKQDAFRRNLLLPDQEKMSIVENAEVTYEKTWCLKYAMSMIGKSDMLCQKRLGVGNICFRSINFQ
ncbi:hypothetical protein CDAR_424321 [Caerostris darwini]|uniref:Uncharacterized protein n=1 Tax=Caerostris darwini TaxID=1538125 RepID=A0AAV4T4J3_9ARAC|nr:hypothetical protein CDAR_424321 [Caerostris darwini]